MIVICPQHNQSYELVLGGPGCSICSANQADEQNKRTAELVERIKKHIDENPVSDLKDASVWPTIQELAESQRKTLMDDIRINRNGIRNWMLNEWPELQAEFASPNSKEQEARVLKERALMLQTLGRALFVEAATSLPLQKIFTGEYVEVLNWCERTGRLLVRSRDKKEHWIEGTAFAGLNLGGHRP